MPAPAAPSWAEFLTLLRELTKEPVPEVAAQVRRVLKFFTPLLRQTYDEPEQRLEDLRKLRDLGERFEDRASFLAELTLDPPTSTQDMARASAQAKDFLVLSTIHSAKGLEWDAVFVINATEGAIPSNRAGDLRPARRGAAPVLRRLDASQDLADGHLSPLPHELPGPLGGLGTADADAVLARCCPSLVPGIERLKRFRHGPFRNGVTPIGQGRGGQGRGGHCEL